MSSNGVVSSPTPIGPYSPVKNGRLNTAPSRQGTAMTEGSTMMVDNGPEGVWGKPSSPGGTVESPSRPSTQSRWMDRMMLESTRMLEPRGNSDFVVGYTGHVPRVRETFAVNNKVASNAIYEKSSGIGSMTRVADVQGGRRLLVTTPTTQLPGTGTFATTTSIGRVRKEGYENLDVYHQGYKVHLQSYYESCAANGYKDILIKAGFAGTDAQTQPLRHSLGGVCLLPDEEEEARVGGVQQLPA
ncbi:hypothetical protein T484DRAFT_1838044 [Baffinella frigidus]|nr:hypothetical protein T484DRAFT_1838044 [Cryptophyta sp. CCMP2293]